MQTFKRYLVFQGMMFVFGIVGPIFLIGYFMSQPDPTLKWMYWWGLFITFADVFIALRLTKAGDAKSVATAGRSTAISPELTIADRRIP